MPLLDTLLPNASADVVGLFSSDLAQVFGDARPMKATVKETSKLMEHPIETGATITDHRVVQPIEIELELIATGANYRNIYQQIRQMFFDAKLLTVQTKTASYENMVIQEMPHEESGDMFDAVPIAVRLKEVLFVSAQYGTLPADKVRNPAMASTKQKGQQQGTAASAPQENKAKGQSVLYGVFN